MPQGQYSEADIQQAPAPAQHGRYSEADVLPEQSFGAAAEEYGRKMNPVAMAQGIAQNVYHPIEAIKRWGDVNNRLLSNAEDAAKRGDYTEAAAHALHYVLNGIPGLGEALDEAGTKMRDGDIAGGLADTAALGTQIVAGAKAPAIAKALGTAGQYTAAATKAAAPGVLGGMAKAGAGEVLAKLPGMELPARFGLQYPALRQVAKAIEKGHEAGMKAVRGGEAAPAAAAAPETAAPRPKAASPAPSVATATAAPAQEASEAPAATPGKTAADLLNEEMGTKAVTPVTAKAPGQALAESHGETWSKLSEDDKLSYAQLEGAQATSEARNAAAPSAYTPRPPEYYGVKAAEAPPPQPPPSAPAPAQATSAAPPQATTPAATPASAAPSATVQPIRQPTTPEPVKPAATPTEAEDIDFQQRYGEQEQPEVAKFLGHEQPAPEAPSQPKPASGATAAKSARYADAISKWAKDMGMSPKDIADQWGTTTPEVRGQILLQLKQKGYLGANETIPRTSAQGIVDALKAKAATIKPPSGFGMGSMKQYPPEAVSPAPSVPASAAPSTIAEAPASTAEHTRPSLGDTGRDIYQGWKSLAEGPQPPRAVIEGFVPGLGRFDFRRGQIVRLFKQAGKTGTVSTYEPASNADIAAIHDAIDKGQFQVEQRTISGAGGVRKFEGAGALEKVFHQATGKPLPEFLATPEGAAWWERMNR